MPTPALTSHLSRRPLGTGSHRRLAALVALFSLVLAACTTSSPPPSTIVSAAGPVGLHPYSLTVTDSCEALLSEIQNRVLPHVSAWGLGSDFGWGFPILFVADLAGSEGGAAAPGARAGETTSNSSYLGTNLQELGVDEPDFVKTDGRLIVAVADTTLTIVDVATTRVLSNMELSDPASELLLVGDHAVVFAHPQFFTTSADVIESEMARLLPSPWSTPHTTLTLVDLSDPSSPVVDDSLVFEGSYVTSRLSDGLVRVVLSSWGPSLSFTYPSDDTPQASKAALAANRRIVSDSSLSDWLPAFGSSGTEDLTDPLVECEDVFLPPYDAGFGLTSILTFDPARGLDFSSSAVYASASTVYASLDSIYLATQRWEARAAQDGGPVDDAPPPVPGATVDPTVDTTVDSTVDTTVDPTTSGSEGGSGSDGFTGGGPVVPTPTPDAPGPDSGEEKDPDGIIAPVEADPDAVDPDAVDPDAVDPDAVDPDQPDSDASSDTPTDHPTPTDPADTRSPAEPPKPDSEPDSAEPDPDSDIDIIQPVDPAPVSSFTDIHAFDFTPSATAYVASGRVDGTLLSSWSLSEHEGVLRVVTTTSSGAWSRSGPDTSTQVRTLRPLDGRLVELASIDGLGKGESVFAVRFLADLAFVVTYRQIDPLYVVDLSDPTSPVLRGELKIPGYSGYLHPISDELLLGVGQAGDDDGRTFGAQISLFDISDLSQPTLADSLTFRDSYAAVEWDHHAFQYDPDTHRVYLPIESWAARPRDGEAFFSSRIVVASVDPATRTLSSVTDLYRPADAPFRDPYGEVDTFAPGEPFAPVWAPPFRRLFVFEDRLAAIAEDGLLFFDPELAPASDWLYLTPASR